ncbi:glycosyltransferase family 2 protein [Nodosilinea sp. P-1105]|uniref:glycosyltransferase family 2 protein n=1 Tax=Nodosilinea sp. P-1105 TaxID=2546229 RepID=UPI00146F145B|nr:glycosyltransferase family 2 protein [Nodosilinea sp. P-1105]NMF85921.1 glycosyltransferase [Nodosilinea sp. P-1105]
MTLSFSVITPSYNQGQFIERTIKSVLNQAGVEFEYIVCDGGSTDHTLAILQKYEAYLRWYSEPDGGQADAVNKGIRNTTGNIIAWINSDDIYYPGTFEKIRAIFTNHPEVQALYGRADWIEADNTPLKEYPTRSWSYQRLKQECFLCQPAVFFRRSLVEQYGDLDVSLNYCLDYELWLRYGKHVSFLYVPDKLAGSRMYAANKTIAQSLAAHCETNIMLSSKFGIVPGSWLVGYALVKTEMDSGISRFDTTRTYEFLTLLVRTALLELFKHNKPALLKMGPKMLFWLLFPNLAWFRRENIVHLI